MNSSPRQGRSHSTSLAPGKSRFSLGGVYNRQSMPNRPAAADLRPGGGINSVSSDDGDVEVDMGGLDMFNRQSIAMFERYNKEQVCALLKNSISLTFNADRAFCWISFF